MGVKNASPLFLYFFSNWIVKFLNFVSNLFQLDWSSKGTPASELELSKMKAVVCNQNCGNYRRKNSDMSLFSTRRRTLFSTSSTCLFLVVILLFVSKSSLAKEFYYHPDKVLQYNSGSGDNDPQHEPNTMMEFVSTSTSATRSNEAPSISSTNAAVSETSTTIASTLSSSPTTSRPNQQDIVASAKEKQAKEKGELISHVISLGIITPNLSFQFFVCTTCIVLNPYTKPNHP